MAKHLYTYINPTCERDLVTAVRVLAQDGVLAYPTDVNWAFGCDPSSTKALNRIRALKPQHPKEQPFSLLCSSVAMIASVAHIDNMAYRVLKKTLPGPYTYLLPRTHDLPRQIKDKRKVVGVRMPACPLLLDLITLYGKPLATTSLPLPSQPEQNPLTFGYQIDSLYGHALDLILDLGSEVLPAETSIINFSSGVCIIVRAGAGDLSHLKGISVDLPV